MLTIRFARVGRKKQAFFKLVVADKQKAVQKKFVEKLGFYNPHTNGGEGEFVFEADRVKHFIKNGAQMSQTAARRLAKAGIKEAEKFIEQRVTKPKKEEVKEEQPAEEVAETPEEEATPAEAKEEVAEETKSE